MGAFGRIAICFLFDFHHIPGVHLSKECNAGYELMPDGSCRPYECTPNQADAGCKTCQLLASRRSDQQCASCNEGFAPLPICKDGFDELNPFRSFYCGCIFLFRVRITEIITI